MRNLTRKTILTAIASIWILFSFLAVTTYDSKISYLFAALTLISMCLMGIALKDITQTKHSLLRNYPLIGRLRFVFEEERSKIQQYFIEHDTNGTPYNREKRSDVYQKAKGELNTVPFGTQIDVYKPGYEFIKHSLYPKNIKDISEPRVTIGNKFCKQPYSASIINISAMSFGALSDVAIKSLNGGAKLGNFFHNTGEGGLSEYHLQGGDICFQFGTGYFGAGETIDGVRYFSEKAFKQNAKRVEVKLIEVKLSQGSKPGLGGILPAKKNSEEIAKIRGIEPNIEVISPPSHTAFSNATEMLSFIKKLRVLSDGKPIGIKMCVGDFDEVDELIKMMSVKNIYPDFITIDGSEGGTGSAPLVFTNSVGTPLVDALIFINETLKKYNLRNEIKIIASGKASTSFDIVKLIALGADMVNAARAFMLSLGCIQARECNSNTCPVGIATQNKSLTAGLDHTQKNVRVFNYHKNIIHEVKELMAAMGITYLSKLSPKNINIRVDEKNVKTYA